MYKSFIYQVQAQSSLIEVARKARSPGQSGEKCPDALVIPNHDMVRVKSGKLNLIF